MKLSAYSKLIYILNIILDIFKLYNLGETREAMRKFIGKTKIARKIPKRR